MHSPLAVSIYIITLNEQEVIGKLLDSLTGFQEVIVVDSGSSDKTVELAQSYSNVNVSYRQWSGFSDQKSHALSLCSCTWVLNLDADEELTNAYVAAMKSVMEAKEFNGLESKRVLLRWGNKPKCFTKDDILIRFFKKEFGHYKSARVHEKITIAGPILKTNAYLLHHEDLTFSDRIQKSNQYSQLKAEDKYAKGNKCGLFTLVFIFPWSYLQCYLGKGHFMDGVDGILTSMNFAYYNFMKYAKLWEMYKRRVSKKG